MLHRLYTLQCADTIDHTIINSLVLFLSKEREERQRKGGDIERQRTVRDIKKYKNWLEPCLKQPSNLSSLVYSSAGP